MKTPLNNKELKAYLIETYVKNKKSTRKIADELGKSASYVSRKLKEFDIPIRHKRSFDMTKEELEELYINQGKSSYDIAAETGWSPGVIVRKLSEFNIQTDFSKSRKIIDELTYDFLYEEYVLKEKTALQIASDLGISKRSVLLKLDELGVPIRHRPKTTRKENINTNLVEEMYLEKHMSLEEIAKELDASIATVSSVSIDLNLVEKRRQKEFDLIRAALDNGSQSFSSISRETRIPITSVRSRCKEKGWTPPSKQKQLIEIDSDEVIHLYVDERKSVQKIAEQLNVSYSRIYKIIKKADVMREPGKIEVDRDRLYKRYVEDRASYAELCAEFDISPITLNRILRRYDISLNRDVNHIENWKGDAFAEYVKAKCRENDDLLYVQDLVDYFNVCAAGVRKRIRETDTSAFFHRYFSSAERKWQTWLVSQNIPFSSRNRDLIAPAEIDIVLDNLPIGLEINPSATHNSDINVFDDCRDGLPITYHQNKAIAAEKAGINLIQIFDWQDEEKIKEIILGLCGKNHRIYARNTRIKDIPYEDEKAFLEKNHLQGYIKSEFCYGLYFNDDLLALMSFGKPRFNNTDKADWELLRFCTKSGTTVVGGASKLFSHFVKSISPKKVMSFCNYDISNGNMYEKLGFEYVRTTAPSYYWVRLNDTTEFYSWNLILSKGYDNVFGTKHGKGTDNITLMLEDGFVRVYNSGNKVYIWESN